MVRGAAILAAGAAAVAAWDMGWGAAILAAMAAAWVVSRVMSSSSESDSKKLMKTPGRFSYVMESSANTNTIKIMSYNVCFEEKYPIDERMKAIGDLVQYHSPNIICFQEITFKIYKIFQNSSWWRNYHCSVSEEEASVRQFFCIVLSKYALAEISNTTLGSPNANIVRLSVAEIMFRSNESLFIASGHLKSARSDNSDPKSRDPKFTKKRQLQAKEALRLLEKYPDVIFCGDMNWDEKTDGEFPLPNGWIDAWTELRGKENGETFIHGHLSNRLDRIFCKLKEQVFNLDNIDRIGMDAIPDVYFKPSKTTQQVWPSDHYGLTLAVSF